jgi:hypothetical protein
MFPTSDKYGQIRELVETLFDDATQQIYFGPSAESPESIVNRPEVDHLIHISSVHERWWKTLNPHNARDFKESDAYWLFFSAVTKYYQTLPSTDVDAKITVKE